MPKKTKTGTESNQIPSSRADRPPMVSAKTKKVKKTSRGK